jgi:tRNA/tmRNA/rRNA uracil-C5-methylase (TrmA/RlmC/RlmD family)
MESGPATQAPSPELSIGTRHEVDIRSLAFGGEGVARVQEFVLFVPFALPGERVDTEIVERHPRYARGRLISVKTAAAERVTPRCRYFGQCGGCQYQHLDYPVQLRVKRQQVIDILQRVGGLAEPPVDPVVPCPVPYGYRNRIMVRTQWDRTQQALNLGFLRHDNRLVVDIERCELALESLNRELGQVRASPPPKGGIKVVLRENPPGWHVPRDSFFQNNPFLLETLARIARERLQEAGSRFLIDAYCGVGFFSLELASAVESFVGIELDAPAIRAARLNAADRQIHHGEYRGGKSEDLIAHALQRWPPATTTLVVDPPRAGCHPALLQCLAEVRPAQVLYVSCHPATLARDLKFLCRHGGYRLHRVVPLDMFPQTQHVECVADLRLAAGIEAPESGTADPVHRLPENG